MGNGETVIRTDSQVEKTLHIPNQATSGKLARGQRL
jgi:hypothetical protein